MATEAAFSLSAVQQRASETIASVLSSTAATPWLYELLPGGTRDVGSSSYGVGITRSVPTEPTDKQRPGVPLNAEATVGVRILYRLRGDALEDDYRLGLALGDLAIAAMLDAADSDGPNADQKWQWSQTTHRVVADGTYLLIEQTYTCWFHASTSL